MEIKVLKPRKALNKAFLKVKPNRVEIEGFKTELINLLDRTNDTESEEFHKNLVIDFLKKTYYDPHHFINTKGRNDLVIHNGNTAKTSVGVIIEAKKPTNKTEMIKPFSEGDSLQQRNAKLNTKAFQELVLYYLRERITHNNFEVKHLVATNINEWFIFDARLFNSLFAENKILVKQFTDFEAGRLAGIKTDFFYKQIAEPFIAALTSEIEYCYFNLQDYQKPLRNADKEDDNILIALFKLLSPQHLLKLPFTNDSNSLDKRFYSELLHLIGLTETKDGSKKLIERNKPEQRNSGSLLEDAIIQLDSMDKLNRLAKPNQFGSTQSERLFNVALELSITWINRILFLKLLEAQLISYHKSNSNKAYSFLNLEKIKNYDDLNSLFFQVLARKHSDRNEDVKMAFEKVPYLNSSLFEPTDLEQETLFISNLKDDKTLPVITTTVLKDEHGKKKTGNLNTLQYLFEFLNAYDFSSEGSAAIQEDNKSLINASVLGLIFEKINGYKDGSFFTPGFITMYMCRETIRKAVVQKFNETKKWNCNSLDELYDKIEDRKEANNIVNSIKICDPAVGSGHFLVSALNEMIAVKNDLKILQDRDGKRLKEYQVEVVNDELIVTDEEDELFEYNPNNKESQRIQETLFHEKQTIIENCLFGVDINANSVKICRLRLWIELLKNAYYLTPGSNNSHSNPSVIMSGVKHSPPLEGGVPEGGGGSTNLSAGEIGSNLSPEGDENSNLLSEGEIKYNNLPYLKTFRKELRNNLTPAEAKLWILLKGKQLEGRKFRRQHSFANYILDFYCPEERIAIELDGQGHFEATQAEYDRERDLFLKTFGIRVLRFENKWVWDNPAGLLEIVVGYFGKQAGFNQPLAVNSNLVNQPPRPADTPPLGGGELEHDSLMGLAETMRVSEAPRPADTPPLGGGELEHDSLMGLAETMRVSEAPRPADTPPLRGGELEHDSLQTLPNIDINIKCGNSLVSRFAIDADLKQALKKSKWSIDSYRIAVDTYRNAQNKEQKREMERLINDIKSDFRSEISLNDPKNKKLRKVQGDLFLLTNQQQLFEMSKKEKADWTKKIQKLTDEIKILETEIEEIKANKIFENAFEWRFEFPEVLNDDGDFVGFDVVIGNPPYISLSKLKKQSDYFSKAGFQTYSKGADLYCLFYELGGNILNSHGLLTYITSNSWLRAIYGELLKKYFINILQPTSLLNIEDVQIFEEATVESNIIMLQKGIQSNSFWVANMTKQYEFGNSLSEYFESNKFKFTPPQTSEWFIGNQLVGLLKNKIEKESKLLKDFDVRINFGIKTGYNQAFIIDDKKRSELIEEDNKNNEIIKPIIRGRDLKKYSYEFSKQWVICTFPSLKLDIKKYPTVENYFIQIGKHRLEQSGEIGSRKKTANKWFETQDSIGYWQDFEKPKIIWGEISDKPKFAYDNDNYYAEATTFLMTGEKLKFLLGILNSRISEWYFNLIGTTTGMGTNRWKKYKIEMLPIKVPNVEQEEKIENLVNSIIIIKKQNPLADTSNLESQIDQLVYQLYNLTEQEIKIIEQA